MKYKVFGTKQEMGAAAAEAGAAKIRGAIALRGGASIIVATGASQFEMLDALVGANGIEWDKVTAFHLDEYVGLPISHPASFRRYLWERFVRRLPLPPRGVSLPGCRGRHGRAHRREKSDHGSTFNRRGVRRHR